MPNIEMMRFYENVRDDLELEKKYRDCGAVPEKITSLANSMGYNFTVRELEEELAGCYDLDSLRSKKPEGDELHRPHPCLP